VEQRSVRGWSFGDGVILESYRYAPGPASEDRKHSHDQYQFCLSLNFPGEYRYRGERYPVPVGSLSVIHPGEIHASRDPFDREESATYRVMYADPDLLREAATQAEGSGTGEPFFPDPIVLDGDLTRDFLMLHLALENSAPRLEQDTRLLDLLSRLIARRAEKHRALGPSGGERRSVTLVRGYLEDNLARNVSLEELARLTNLSSYHLARAFAAEVGLPPHAYQVQARVHRARHLLLRGLPIAQAAQQTGFSDQSHLTRCFKRFVGVPPGSYVRAGKGVRLDV
jgi:AraC-like DNA-binding protein